MSFGIEVGELEPFSHAYRWMSWRMGQWVPTSLVCPLVKALPLGARPTMSGRVRGAAVHPPRGRRRGKTLPFVMTVANPLVGISETRVARFEATGDEDEVQAAHRRKDASPDHASVEVVFSARRCTTLTRVCADYWPRKVEMVCAVYRQMAEQWVAEKPEFGWSPQDLADKLPGFFPKGSKVNAQSRSRVLSILEAAQVIERRVLGRAEAPVEAFFVPDVEDGGAKNT